MMLNRIARPVMMLAAVFVVATLVGCGANPKKFDVEVSIDPELKSFTVPVDIVGINNETDLPGWSNYEVDKYFSAGDPKRAGATRYDMRFVPGGPDHQTLSVSDAVWDRWNKPGNIIVFAQIPQYAGDRGATDGRRKVLPTMSDSWQEDKLQIVVRRSGLEVRTPQKKK